LHIKFTFSYEVKIIMKILVAPDSFKGSLSAVEAAKAMEKGILKAAPAAEVCKVPMADGGEGTVEALLMAAGGELRKAAVTGPLGEKINSFYGILADGKTGVVEMAAASGLILVPEDKRNPMLTTTYGTGELIAEAVKNGCRKVVIGIGGSATNDGGMGMAQALGVKFLDRSGRELGFGGRELAEIHSIDCSGMNPALREVEFFIACDVTNPLCGPEGAAYVYGPQKGADLKMVCELDKGLENFAAKIREYINADIRDLPGAGAAGGLGGGLVAFLNARLEPGIKIMTEATGLKDKIRDARLVFTGEGRTDSQTAYGKVPLGVARIAKQYGIPVICLSGGLGDGIEALYDEGISCFFSIADKPMTLDDAMRNGAELLTASAENLMRFYMSILA
jgi:glycerate kinase